MIELPKLQDSIPITDGEGRPSLEFHRWWQEIARTLEGQLNTINGEIETLIAAAQTAADTAQTDATNAQADATQAAREAARISSYTSPTVILSAADTGSVAKISVANHDRIYPVQGSIAVPPVSLTGLADITGLAYSTAYYLYYDDTTLLVTTPTIHATTIAETAQVGSAAGRHFLGFITTPASGAGATSGAGSYPSGGGGHYNL